MCTSGAGAQENISYFQKKYVLEIITHHVKG